MPNMSLKKNEMPSQEPNVRNKNFLEVALGYTEEQALDEAARCLNCKNHPCVSGCPVQVKIPEFIKKITEKDYEGAYQVIHETSSLPAVCGRVCPQETQCESKCIRGIKGEPVGIGRLERFVADWHNANVQEAPAKPAPNGHKVAVIGSGPSGLTCAGDLAKKGYQVSIFEALHTAGGVLMYGIPEFRLPKKIVELEVNGLKALGVKIVTNVVIGRSMSIDDLFDDGFEAVYIGSGAGLPRFMGIPGESLKEVYSANEYLTRVNLMKAYQPGSTTPIYHARKVAVVGGGNVAMDVARSAVRCGAEKVSIVYRRRICDMTAQDAEIAGAQAEGCEVLELTAPLGIETGDDGRVSGLRVQPQIIGEPRRGRPAPRAAATPERVIPCERVFVAIGQDIDSKPFEEMGIACKWGCIVTDSDGAVPNFDGLFSGGDCQTGPATVIRAINAGRVASANIDRYLGFDHKIKLEVELPTVQFKGKHEGGRCELGEREAGERIHDWNLVEQGLTEEEARQEASRCLRCDHFGFGAFRGGRNLEW